MPVHCIYFKGNAIFFMFSFFNPRKKNFLLFRLNLVAKDFPLGHFQFSSSLISRFLISSTLPCERKKKLLLPNNFCRLSAVNNIGKGKNVSNLICYCEEGNNLDIRKSITHFFCVRVRDRKCARMNNFFMNFF